MTKELNSIEFLIEQVVMGTYKNGEDKILYKTLPNAMIEAAREKYRNEIAKAFDDGDYNYHYSRKTGNDFEDGQEYYNEVYG
jgi:hypothetical protein